MPRTYIPEFLFLVGFAAAPILAVGQEDDVNQDPSAPQVETGSQPEAQSDDDRIAEEPDAGDAAAGGGADPGPFGFFDPDGGMDIAEGACGSESEAWINTAMMDLDGSWILEIGPSGSDDSEGADGPLAGAGADSVMISEQDGDMIMGGATFASEVPLEVWQGDGIPFAELPGEIDVNSDRAAAAIGCRFDALPRLTARGALSAENGAAPFILVVAVPNARALVGVLQVGEGETARTRLVRMMR